MTIWPHHATWNGPIVMIGFGSIGRGTLPLILRHIACDRSKIHRSSIPTTATAHSPRRKASPLSRKRSPGKNYKSLLKPLLTAGPGQAFIVNLSVDVSSVDILKLAQATGALYIDTVIEPWPGFYYNTKLDNAARTNYAMREQRPGAEGKIKGGHTSVSCCGANPGMVSWFVKQALLDIAAEPQDQGQGADDARGMGQAHEARRRQRHPYRRARYAALQESRSRSTPSSIPGRSTASSRKACSRPNSAGARMRRSCRPAARSTRRAAARRSI